MSELVERLLQEQPLVASLRPTPTPEGLKAEVERGYVHVKFTETRGGTEFGFSLDRERSDLSQANFANATGTIHLVGDLMLDYVPVRFRGNIDLASLKGTGRVEIRDEAAAGSQSGG